MVAAVIGAGWSLLDGAQVEAEAPGYPDIRADGVGAGNNHFRLLPLPRTPSTLICGMVVFLAGWKHLAAISFPLGFLIFMIPSSTLVDQITFPLQILASKTATFLLTGIGVPAIREGKHQGTNPAGDNSDSSFHSGQRFADRRHRPGRAALGVEGAQGTRHLLSGWLIFAGSLLLIFALHRLSRIFLAGKQTSLEAEEYA
jgi:hypothetical protein